ncbi:MAG: hypothetical protein ACOVRM_14920, partial [Planctomycetaceae bacterium]
METSGELQQITLLFEIDELAGRVRRWAQAGPAWRPAQTARALTLRVLERVQTVRLRLESPLVVATFGGTGTNINSLIESTSNVTVSAPLNFGAGSGIKTSGTITFNNTAAMLSGGSLTLTASDFLFNQNFHIFIIFEYSL